MTLHTYAAFDGVLLCMSDSRTTYTDGRKPRQDTIKTVTYPLGPATWAPGQLAAAVMTQERAEFTHCDDEGNRCGETIEPWQVVHNVLASQSFDTIEQVGLAVWEAFSAQMLTCPYCRRANVAYPRESSDTPENVQQLEVGCEEENHALEVHVVGLVGAEATPKRYARRWDAPDFDFGVQDLPDRTVYRSGFLVRRRQDEREPITGNVTAPVEHSTAFQQMQRWFDSTVKNPAYGLAGRVGGPIRTVVIDPTTGLAMLPAWTLEEYRE